MTKKASYSELVQTPVGRVSYPSLAQPSNRFNENKYKVTLLFPKDDKEGIEKMKAEIKALVKAHWGGKPPKGFSVPLKDGDERYEATPDDKKEAVEAYKGCFYLTPHTKKKPVCVGRDRTNILPEEIYGGCYARALVKFSTYEQQGGGITCYLQGVQFCKDGERFGGSLAFEDFEGEADAYFGDNGDSTNATESAEGEWEW